MVKEYDLLNNVYQDRVRNVIVSAYVINEVKVTSFIKSEVRVSPNTKFVQVKTLAMKFGDEEYFLDAFLYASVPIDTKVGEFCFLQGTLSPVSKENYSKECSIFKFRKSNGEWWLDPIKVSPFNNKTFSSKLINSNLNYWRKFPLTLTTGNTAYVQPITRMVETEILFDLDNSKYENQDEYDLKDYNFSNEDKLTDLQKQIIKEMLVYPIVQFRSEHEEFLSNEELANILKRVIGEDLVLLDIRAIENSSLDVLRTIESKGKFADGKYYWVLANEFVRGIPSILFGLESLI